MRVIDVLSVNSVRLQHYHALVLVLALVLGGGPQLGSWPEAGIQLASLPLIAAAFWKFLNGQFRRRMRVPILLVLAVVAVPLFQLISLPPAIWSILPGRASIASAYAEAGMPLPWLPVSLDAGVTWRTTLTLLPAIGIFLSTLAMDRRSRRQTVLVLIAFGFASVVLGLAQVAQGPQSALHLYSGGSGAVGFFANRNHYAALLYSVLPFTIAWAVGLAADRRPQLLVGLALCLLVFISLVLGIGIARSRAGVVLSVLVVLGSLALARGADEARPSNRFKMLLSIATLVAIFLVIQFALLGILQRFEADIGEDLRWRLAENTLRAAPHYLPFGSGIGTFSEVYLIHERTAELQPNFVNHAHNDFVELWLEGGVLALGVLLAWLAWFVMSSARTWRGSTTENISALDGAIARAGTIAIGAFLLHSVVDFPLRSTALSAVLAFCCALLVLPPRPGKQRIRSSQHVSPEAAPN